MKFETQVQWGLVVVIVLFLVLVGLSAALVAAEFERAEAARAIAEAYRLRLCH